MMLVAALLAVGGYAQTAKSVLDKAAATITAPQGVKAAATMVSGRDFETRAKLSRNLVGLCLNSKVVEKTAEQ